MPASDVPQDPPGRQLPLFSDVAATRTEEPPTVLADEPIAEAPATDSRQIELFADAVVLARDLDLALSAGRFEEATRLRLALIAAFGPSETLRVLAVLDPLALAAWEAPPAAALTTWAEIDRQLVAQTSLRDRVRKGAFARLLETHSPVELLEGRPECLPVLVRVLAAGSGRSPEEGRREARGLVRDALLTGRTLDALDFREDEALADLLAENLTPVWLACLGRIRRLWTAPPPRDSERESLRAMAADEAADDPAMAFWHCLRLAESPDCPEDLRLQARRRMKQLNPDLHVLFMRRAASV
jgi:hypothetical protein